MFMEFFLSQHYFHLSDIQAEAVLPGESSSKRNQISVWRRKVSIKGKGKKLKDPEKINFLTTPELSLQRCTLIFRHNSSGQGECQILCLPIMGFGKRKNFNPPTMNLFRREQAPLQLSSLVGWSVGWSVGLSIGPHNEILKSAYVKIWLPRNCFALAPGLDYS
jgi:hypothetical protein